MLFLLIFHTHFTKCSKTKVSSNAQLSRYNKSSRKNNPHFLLMFFLRAFLDNSKFGGEKSYIVDLKGYIAPS